MANQRRVPLSTRLKRKNQNQQGKKRQTSRVAQKDGVRQKKQRLQKHKTDRKPYLATVQKNWKGFAFLVFNQKEREDLFVPPAKASQFFHGDRVSVEFDDTGRMTKFKLIEHRFKEIIGKYVKSALSGWVIYEKKSVREEIFVPKVIRPVQEGDWVRARLEFHSKGPFFVTAEILQVYGKDLLPSVDLSLVATEFNLMEDHSKAAVEEAQQLGSCVSSVAQPPLRDLTQIAFVTIDGENARDFDDAVFVEKKKSGYCLWVAIAHVSAYVTPRSPLDLDARERGTSVYFPEKAFHMLPSALSEGLCSLKPHEPRLSLVARMEWDQQGKRTSTELMEGLIVSQRRLTYSELDLEWRNKKEDSHWEYFPHFELYQRLRKKRMERGSIDFELPEAEVEVKGSGEVVSIRNRARLPTHRLIEEFMIAANEAVTEWMMERNWPFIYRIHEEPSVRSLEKFQALAATVGVEVSFKKGVSPKIFSDLVKRLEGHPAQFLLNQSLLRSMKQAIYSSVHGIHYGLASGAYTHFTSPIRRYPDLIVHRLIRMALQFEAQGKKLSEGLRSKLEKDLAEVCAHCSYRERLAAEAEREMIKIKQVRLMSQHVGEDFQAKVVGMISAGIFVQLEDPFVEGMIQLETITGDFYEFHEERMIFRGRRTKQVVRIGDSLCVRLVRTDLEKRQIDFIWLRKSV